MILCRWIIIVSDPDQPMEDSYSDKQIIIANNVINKKWRKVCIFVCKLHLMFCAILYSEWILPQKRISLTNSKLESNFFSIFFTC